MAQASLPGINHRLGLEAPLDLGDVGWKQNYAVPVGEAGGGSREWGAAHYWASQGRCHVECCELKWNSVCSKNLLSKLMEWLECATPVPPT